jgi:mRNA (guanine-N7-)-methyltransferase
VAPSTAASNFVAQHYNKRKNNYRTTTSGATMLGLRNLNNWIKSVLINQHAGTNASVLDLACGKGGDMLKYTKCRIGHYVGVDVAKISVENAVSRYNADSGREGARDVPMPFTAKFLQGDICAVDLASHLPPALRFDLVSCQFALHYAFESEARARQCVTNAAARLQPGGYFVGTIPDGSVLRSKLKGSPDGKFGNQYFKVAFDPSFVGEGKFEAALARSPFGLRYRFYLEDAVDEVPEYMISKPVLVALAKEQGMTLTSWKNFHDFFDDEKDKHFELLQRMKVLPPPHYRLTEAEWEVSYVYNVFAFQKDQDGPVMRAPHPGRPVHTHVDPADIVECAKIEED